MKMKKVANNYDQLVAIFKTLKVEVEQYPIEVSWEPWKPKKSPGQNSLLHVWISEIHQHLIKGGITHFDIVSPDGEVLDRREVTETTVKDHIKAQFGPKVRFLDLTTDLSTSKYTREWMSDVLGEVQAWAATELSLDLHSREEENGSISDQKAT